MPDTPPTLGLVLAGGLARRMGGDKAFVELGGRPLLALALERLGAQCDRVAINANGPALREREFGATVVADGVAGFPGPLAGVLAGLDYAAAAGLDFIATLPVDTPFAPRDLVARLHRARRAAGANIAVAASGGRRHHVVALWPVSIADDLREALTVEQERGVARYCARHAVAEAEWPTTPFDPFFNINTPEDLGEAERRLAEVSSLRR